VTTSSSHQEIRMWICGYSIPFDQCSRLRAAHNWFDSTYMDLGLCWHDLDATCMRISNYTRRLVHCLFHGGRDDLRLIANYEPALPARAYERAREAEQTIHFGEL